jgi:ABC-type ATPase with predicted acetyltransferase domain
MTSQTVQSPPPESTLTPWPEARSNMGWKQGEHVTIIGPTGQGKTTLALDLMGQRGYPLIIATKPRDATLEKMSRGRDWHVITDWPPARTKTILWPKLNRTSDVQNQADVIHRALENVFISGGYAVLIDELSYVIDTLKCRREVTQIWQQGRALGISLVTCILRPTHIPLLAYDQATHIIMFRDNDETNLRRMGGLGHWSK